MLSVTLKNVPLQLHARLKESAAHNRRSLNSEILARLEGGVGAPLVDRELYARELKSFTARLPRVAHAKVPRYKRQGRA